MKFIHSLVVWLRRKPIVKVAIAFLLATSVSMLTACTSGVLAPKGQVAQTELKLIIFAIVLMLIVVIPVIVLSLWFAWRYREGGKGVYRPEWSHSNLLELVWWAIPIIIIGILATVTWYTTHSLDPYKPLELEGKPVKIDVVALDWKWLFIYPEEKIATVNYIRIPTHRPVDFRVTAAAPMNSLIIPQLAGQVYAMTGMETALHLVANEPGRYRGFSANYTGNGFAEMEFYAEATSEKDYRRWVRSVKQKQNRLGWTRFWNTLAKPSISDPVMYFGRVNPALFDDIVMSYMMPNYHPKRLNMEQKMIVEQHKQR